MKSDCPGLFRAISYGMRELSKGDQEIAEEQVDQTVSDMKNQMGAQMQQQMWIGMLYAYNDVSDSELEEYLMLCASPAGKLTADFSRTIFMEMYMKSVSGLQKSWKLNLLKLNN